MKLFLDTANLADIEEALAGGFIRGITTNPSLLAKEPKGNYLAHMKKIVVLCRKYGGAMSFSVEVFSNNPREMIAQARQFAKELKYKHLAVKIPIGYQNQNNLSVIRELSARGITVNCTACMTPLQLTLAAASGARYVSLFYNRLRDSETEEKYANERAALLERKAVQKTDFDPDQVLRETCILLSDYPDAEIIVGSIRTPLDVKRAGLSGGHIVTASLPILKASAEHFKTDHAVEQFLADFKQWRGI